MSTDLYQLLAEVLTLEQSDERLGCVLDSFGDGFAVLDLARRHVATEFLDGFGPQVQVVADDEALQVCAGGEQSERILDGNGLAVITGNEAAQRDAGADVEAFQHRVEDLAADVLEINVDALRRRGLEQFVEIRLFVIDAGIEPELITYVVALGLAACGAHRAAALDLRELSDHASHRAA